MKQRRNKKDGGQLTQSAVLPASIFTLSFYNLAGSDASILNLYVGKDEVIATTYSAGLDLPRMAVRCKGDFTTSPYSIETNLKSFSKVIAELAKSHNAEVVELTPIPNPEDLSASKVQVKIGGTKVKVNASLNVNNPKPEFDWNGRLKIKHRVEVLADTLSMLSGVLPPKDGRFIFKSTKDEFKVYVGDDTYVVVLTAPPVSVEGLGDEVIAFEVRDKYIRPFISDLSWLAKKGMYKGVWIGTLESGEAILYCEIDGVEVAIPLSTPFDEQTDRYDDVVKKVMEDEEGQAELTLSLENYNELLEALKQVTLMSNISFNITLKPARERDMVDCVLRSEDPSSGTAEVELKLPGNVSSGSELTKTYSVQVYDRLKGIRQFSFSNTINVKITEYILAVKTGTDNFNIVYLNAGMGK